MGKPFSVGDDATRNSPCRSCQGQDYWFTQTTWVTRYMHPPPMRRRISLPTKTERGCLSPCGLAVQKPGLSVGGIGAALKLNRHSRDATIKSA
jgi:hypothetical protein